jgi:hypothetical protein
VLIRSMQAKKLVVYLDKERFGADFSNPLVKADVELALQPVLLTSLPHSLLSSALAFELLC